MTKFDAMVLICLAIVPIITGIIVSAEVSERAKTFDFSNKELKQAYEINQIMILLLFASAGIPLYAGIHLGLEKDWEEEILGETSIE